MNKTFTITYEVTATHTVEVTNVDEKHAIECSPYISEEIEKALEQQGFRYVVLSNPVVLPKAVAELNEAELELQILQDRVDELREHYDVKNWT